jgi:hypothetical protein
MSPVFTCEFDDGETFRLSVFHKKPDRQLDWPRGRKLAHHAWMSRAWQRSVNQVLAENPIPPRPTYPGAEASEEQMAEYSQLLADRAAAEQHLRQQIDDVDVSDLPVPEISECSFEWRGTIHRIPDK